MPLRSVFTMLALITLLTFSYDWSASASNEITWAPSSLSQNATIGTTSSVQVDLISGASLMNLQLTVVPELSPYVYTSPSTFSVSRGVPQSVTLFFSIPKGTPERTLNGTIHLRSGNKVIARPLPVTINLRQPTSTEIPLALALPSPDRITIDPNLENTPLVKDEIDIFFKDPTPQAAILALITQIGGVIIGTIPDLNLYQVQTAQEGYENLSNVIDVVAQDPIVDLAIHHTLSNSSRIPNDPGFPQSYGPAIINLPAAWDIAIGSNAVNIAIVDGVFDNKHPDLQGNIGKPAVNSAPLVESHGTQVAGIVGAKGNNARDITGTMWNASLFLYSVASPSIPNTNDDILVIQKVNQAIRDHVSILNFSGGHECHTINQSCTRDLEENDAVFARFILSAGRVNPGMLWVFAAGNAGTTLFRSSPARLAASYPNVISVSAVDGQGRLAPFSNYGQDITVAAPGVGILSTSIGGTATATGTSFAAPYVAGVAGLMLSVNPNLSGSQMKTIIHDTAEGTGSFDPEQNEVRLLDAFSAVQQASTFGQCLSFLSFVEGNPGIPGDAVFVSALGGMEDLTFDLAHLIPLSSTTNGFTVTVFPPTNVPSVNQVVLLISNLERTGSCQAGAGFGFFPAGRVILNGVRGSYFNVSQSTLQYAVDFLRGQYPACGITINNLFVESLFLGDSSVQPISTLDAVALCPGQNSFAGTPTQ
jgi:thermitase